MSVKTAFILLSVLLCPIVAISQSRDESIDFNRIPQKAVRDLVLKERVKTASDFQHIATCCYEADHSEGYETNLRTYTVKARIGKVWEKYTNISPKKAWSGSSVRFGFLFSKARNKFVYAENANEPIGVGNIIYVNLRFLRGLKNMGVGFEITRLDEPSKTICFCYLKDGVSTGSQEIRFTEMANGYTRISHLTHYKSRSQFRDKELYPIFHSKFVGEFHQNILSQIETGL